MAFAIHTLNTQMFVLLSPEFRSRYGALYDGLTETKVALTTTTFHTVRCFVLVLLLVLASAYPFFQASLYMASAVVGLGWDLLVRPYASAMTTAQAYLMDTIKLVAGIGYMVLATENIAQETVEKTSRFEIGVLIIGVLVGVIMATVQTAMAAYEQMRRASRSEKEGSPEKMRVGTTNMPSDISLSQNTATVNQPM